MILEDYCSFEIAKLLKEKGFDEFSYYGWDEQLFDKEHPRSFSLGFDNKEHWISCHTHQKAMKWLREVHKIMITIIPQEINVGVDRMCYAIYRITEDLYQPLCNGKVDSFDNSYEEAIEAAIKYSLENLI